MLFAALVIDKEPMKWADVPAALRDWAQTAGVIAALGIVIWSINWVANNRRKGIWPKDNRGWTFLALAGLSAALFALLGLTFLGRGINIRALAQMAPSGNPAQPTVGDWIFTLAGASALLAVAFPILADLMTRFSWRRIWALSRLSLKEAIRSKVVLIFGLMALVFLFADWFVPYKPEDQLRNYVAVIYKSLPPLFLITASLLGAFSIPADIRSQSIHTVVTKPVEKFEIVLGRFIGYSILITVGLAVVSSLSLIYVVRGIHPAAERESFKARVPIYGERSFEGTTGESVGRVWDYRKYIGGRNVREGGKEQYAIWHFDDVPADLMNSPAPVQIEFTFDIYRMTKGKEDQGVFCQFVIADGRMDLGELTNALASYRADRAKYKSVADAHREAGPAAAVAKVEEKIIEDYAGRGDEAVKMAQALRRGTKTTVPVEIEALITILHGVFDRGTVEVKDYHTQALEVPPALFRGLTWREQVQPRQPDSQGKLPAILKVWVNVDSTGANARYNAPQMVGMARPDLYLLATEKPFWLNFYKGIIGLWFTFILALGIAIPCSTYLSGVISWLCTMFLFGAGMARDFVQKLAEGKHEGGGPMESIVRIFTNTFHSGQLDETPTTATLRTVDTAYQYLFKLVYNILPDVKRFYLEKYVANGFDISWGRMLLLDCLLPMVGYLIPWLILGYYLIKYREVANPG